jgi:GNAT superfamily N-acetyltransferase
VHPTLSASVRPATPDDAATIVRLSSEFSDYLRSLGDPNPGKFTVDQYLNDGFGHDRAFSGLFAELNGGAAGYLLYCPGYDFDLGGRIVWIIDLYVTPSARGQGVGRSLMRAVAKACRESGGRQLFWSVYGPNKLGQGFYEQLGAEYMQDLTYMHMDVSDF